jgi:hypothetical protein
MDDWQPATIEEVNEIVTRDLTACDVEQLAAFNKYRVKPFSAPIVRLVARRVVVFVGGRGDDPANAVCVPGSRDWQRQRTGCGCPQPGFEIQSERAKDYAKGVNLGQMRRKADAAWQAKDYAQVVDLYGAALEDLSEVEAKKLAYAEQQVMSAEGVVLIPRDGSDSPGMRA